MISARARPLVSNQIYYNLAYLYISVSRYKMRIVFFSHKIFGSNSKKRERERVREREQQKCAYAPICRGAIITRLQLYLPTQFILYVKRYIEFVLHTRSQSVRW